MFKGKEGSVTVGAVVDRDGTVSRTFIISKVGATREMEQYAMIAVKRWSFPPMVKEGRKLRYVARVPIVFTLGGPKK